MTKFEIQPYGPYDKSILVTGPLDFEVDFDDVWAEGVEIMLPLMVSILNNSWGPIYRKRCENEDCEAAFDKLWHVGDPNWCPDCGRTLTKFEVEQ